MGRTSDARERIIQSSIELIHYLSYSSVGVNELCEHAGVKKGSFYHYFPSKSDLMCLSTQRPPTLMAEKSPTNGCIDDELVLHFRWVRRSKSAAVSRGSPKTSVQLAKSRLEVISTEPVEPVLGVVYTHGKDFVLPRTRVKKTSVFVTYLGSLLPLASPENRWHHNIKEIQTNQSTI